MAEEWVPGGLRMGSTMGMKTDHDGLARFGFDSTGGGAHTARTMMFEELGLLMHSLDRPDAGKEDYRRAIHDENCLGKRSGKTRLLTYRHLVTLYSLDREKVLFRALRFFWKRDIEGRPLLALICAYARDPLLRALAPFIQNFQEGASVARTSLEEFIEGAYPGRFSPATLKSTAQNLNSTWTQSGHLRGKVHKVRSLAQPTAGNTAYALLLGYLSGARGPALFGTEYAKLLDAPFDQALGLAEKASRCGWIVNKRVGNVIEVLFPNLITKEEMEWLREQN